MERSTHTSLPDKLQNKTLLTVALIAFLTFWTCQVAAKTPGQNDDDEAKRRANNVGRSAPMNAQPAAANRRNISVQSSPSNARSYTPPQATVSRPPLASDAVRSIQSRRDSQPTVFSQPQPRSVNTNIRNESVRSIRSGSNVSSPNTQVFAQARSAGTVSNSSPQTFSNQRATQKSADTQPRFTTVAADVLKNTTERANAADVRRQLDSSMNRNGNNTQTRSFSANDPITNRINAAAKIDLAADTSKTTTRSTGNTDTKKDRQDNQDTRQRGRINTTNDNPAAQIQTNQNLRVGGSAGSSRITTTPGGAATTTPSAGAGLRSGTSTFQQRTINNGQNNITTDSGKTNQGLKIGGATGGSKISNNPGGVFTPPPPGDSGDKTTGKNLNLQQNTRTGSNPSMSEIRNRLNDQGRDKGNLTKDNKMSGDKIDATLPKITTKPGGDAKISTTNPADAKLSDVKDKLGTDRSGKHGPPDLNLGNTTDSKQGDKTDLKLNKNADLNIGKSPDLKIDKKADLPSLKRQGGEVGGVGGVMTGKQIPNKLSKGGDIKVNREDMMHARFPDRLKSGELDKVTKGDIAQKVKLSEQYNMMKQGDVARRMEFHSNATKVGGVKNVNINNINIRQINNVAALRNVNDYYAHRPNFHHGAVSPFYAKNCFKFVYFGPGFFAGACWYPHWNPWVAWSWNYHCHPIWDPRPIWCRPVIYDPYYDWVYWQPPVWISLPVVQSGTWVEVQRPVIQPTQYDLQLLAVRFVDPGHQDEKTGPRYRVWFRNNSDLPIEKPFNVMLFAGNDDKLTADLPRSGVRVKAMAAGDTQSVDIRLPIDVATMWSDDDGKPAPFQVLHVMVDANREIADVTPTNNGAGLARSEILSVDPVAFEVDPVKVGVGGELILAGEGLGPQPGQVIVNVAGKELQAEVLGWYDLGVRVNVPQTELNGPTPAEVLVVRGDGAATNPIKVTLLPGQAGPELAAPPAPAPAEL